MLYQDKITRNYYVLIESNNVGVDCYTFNEDKEFVDGGIAYTRDHSSFDTEEEYQKEIAFADAFDCMKWEGQARFCLDMMGTSLENCEVIYNNELEDELMENT